MIRNLIKIGVGIVYLILLHILLRSMGASGLELRLELFFAGLFYWLCFEIADLNITIKNKGTTTNNIINCDVTFDKDLNMNAEGK